MAQLSRRRFLSSLAIAGATPTVLAATSAAQGPMPAPALGPHVGHTAAEAAGVHSHDGANLVVGSVDHDANGFDPHAILTDFDTGSVSVDPDGRIVRTFNVVA